jgi:hypothetical protein
MPAPVQSKSEPKVAENIIFATSPLEAKAVADAAGIPFDQVQWFRSAALLGDADVSESKVHYSAAFTHRQDYAETRDRVKVRKPKRNG